MPRREAPRGTRPLTERRGAERELVSAKERAEEANRVKDEFLATMSHELRTPLNAISGYVSLLDHEIHGPITTAQRDVLARIRANQQQLLRLISQMLDFVKLDAGHVEIERLPVSAARLLSRVEPLLASLAQAKGVVLSSGDCDASVHLLGDEERVIQILINLVGNAIKFTPEGGCVVVACDADRGVVHIHVTDSGAGIPVEKHRAIFEPFTQLGRDLRSPKEGLGLGLTISRDLARAMGGDVSVESAPDQGSIFTLHLPAVVEPESAWRPDSV